MTQVFFHGNELFVNSNRSVCKDYDNSNDTPLLQAV